jgi:hypothetical protein
MKNLYSFLILSGLFFFSSCSSTPGIDDSDFDSCDSGNGFVSATISGSSDYKLDCAIGSVSDITGTKLFVLLNFDIPQINGTKVTFNNYLTIAASLPSSVDSGCESDNEDFQIGTVIYIEDVTINDGDSVEDHPGYYNSTDESMDICFEILTTERAKGTFNGVLYNNEGKEKYISNGKFDFKIQ